MKCSLYRECKMSADVDRAKYTIPFKMSGDVNPHDCWNPSKTDRLQTASRHYSFSQEDKPYYPKRRYSEKYPSGYAGFRRKSARFANRGNQGKIVLPTKFLLGGNISDPLNLNSLCDEEINRSLNEFTPVSSPLPIPGHRLENKVPIIHPANIHDPLNLEDSNEDATKVLMASHQKSTKSRKRRHSHKKHVKTADRLESGDGRATEGGLMNPLSVQIETADSDVFSFPCPPSREGKHVAETAIKKIIDKIVSPVIPQTSPKRKRKRTCSDSRPDFGDVVSTSVQVVNEKERPPKNEKVAASVRSKSKRNSAVTPDFKRKDSRFVHGNYSTYRGYRNPVVEDDRLRMFARDMFEGKDVLEIGCNIGHFTLGVAEKFSPRSITGIDVDAKLIEAAKKNLRHHLSREIDAQFPVSLKILRGPLIAHQLMETEGLKEEGKFPHNITFRQGNYFIECSEEMTSSRSQYDVIVALGITKWIHLNYGDAGLKRCFLRMFQQLRPGGCLILEAQKWGSYRKKKKLTEHTFQIYKSLQFRPDQFREFLTSKEIGFSSCRFLDVPSNSRKGTGSTIQIFTRDSYQQIDRMAIFPTAAVPEPRPVDLSEPPVSMSVDSAESQSSWCESGSAKLEVGSSPFTVCSTCEDIASRSGTPWTERTCSSVECLAGREGGVAFFIGRNDESDQNETDKDAEDGTTMPSFGSVAADVSPKTDQR